jgi:CheY-like chemotaxis protein
MPVHQPANNAASNASRNPASRPYPGAAVRATAELSVLVVDPNPGMRASLQNMLTEAGIGKVEFAVSAATAVGQLARRSHDVVLCEHDLAGGDGQDGQDGQHLLEDLRQHKLISPQTIFIILTAEAMHGKVVSAAELGPTDYILKPFTIETLSRRIEKALDRRAALHEVHRLTDEGQLREALALCFTPEARQSRHAGEFARLGAELHTALGDLEGAAARYQAILADGPRGWASLGLARVLVRQQRHQEAAALLDDIVTANPRLMAAYDLLAQCHAAQGAPQRAQQILQDAVAISPHLVRRHRSLGEMAMDAGDVALAEKSFRQVVTRARSSAFRDPEDHLNLVRALVRKGEAHNAGGIIRDLEKSLRAGADVDACKAYAQALLHEAGGDSGAAAVALATAVQAAVTAPLSAKLKIGLARSCLQHRVDDAATTLVLSMLADEGGMTADDAVALFSGAGRADLADGVQRQLGQQTEDLVAVAAAQSGSGDLKGAVQTLLGARLRSPASLPVSLAAAGAILRQLNELGWDHRLGERAAEVIDGARRHAADSDDVRNLQEMLGRVRRKYGISH